MTDVKSLFLSFMADFIAVGRRDRCSQLSALVKCCVKRKWKWRLHVTFPSTERVLAVSDVLLLSDHVNSRCIQVMQTGLCRMETFSGSFQEEQGTFSCHRYSHPNSVHSV
ncbi:hypothetical protein DPX16_3183 [Anabarilius grahami]|uniref:Uncharacterized protein n=1 Tax=Anabarilius grahami TaxID=495550 RepID=A0A3N0Z037_ANAGA|nr:hypothetical protein DPX16_3183 [Anabarilius grahami]